jgi:hypothetical protein
VLRQEATGALVRQVVPVQVAETVLNIFKAALSTAPFTGGLASLITDYIPSSRFRRLEEFAQRVADDLQAVAGQVDQVGEVADVRLSPRGFEYFR